MTDPVTVELHQVRLPLREPHVAAHGREDTREVIVVSVRDRDGWVGWGECPTLSRPGYSSEWTDGAWWVLSTVLAPRLVEGRAPLALVGHPMASGALADALLDLDLRRRGVGPSDALGPLRSTVEFGVAVGLTRDVGRVRARAEEAVAAGAALVVLKVQPGWAAEPLAAVRRACPHTAVAVDANGSFGRDDLDELRALDAEGPAFIEQPLAADDLLGAVRVRRALRAPIALDEGVSSPEQLATACALGAGSVLTVKPARLGGVAAAARVVEHAAAAGWGVHGGGMLESGVGRAAARLIAARPEVSGPSMVGPTSLLFADDITAAVEAGGDGRLAVHPGPGLVPEPDLERLRALRVRHWVRRP